MSKEPFYKTITAVERDGFDLRLLTLTFEIDSSLHTKNFDLIDAIKKACNDYAKSDLGKETLKYTNGAFNLADFDMHVPRSFTNKYGFRKIETCMSDIEIDWDEQLIDDPDDEE